MAPGPGPAPGHETEAETIRRCLADARSEDVRLRRRAVLILGKYRAAAAVEAVVTCLRDPDDEVRRSAAVAVSEWDVIPRSAQGDLLRLVGDGNVHVRRVASSMLPEMLGGRLGLGEGLVLADRVVTFPGSPRTVAPGAVQQPSLPAGGVLLPAEFPAAMVPVGISLPPGELAALLNRSLGDEDATVRRNVLTAARYLPGVLNRGALEPLLRDPDREIRILAIQAFGQLRGEEAARGDTLAGLVAETDPTARREVGRSLGRLGASGFPGLERLALDADPGVRLQAVQELVQLQHPRGLEHLERCVQDDRIPADERRSLLVYIGFYGEEARALLTRLSTSRSALLRAEAIRGLTRLQGEAPSSGPDFLWPCLGDESAEVRRTAAQGLLRWAASRRARDPATAWPAAEDVSRLLVSPHADVRLFAVRLAAMLAPEARLEALTEACLDDETSVRCEAILNLALLGSPEAVELVARSLYDPQPEVVLSAVRALAMRPLPQSRQQLQSFHDSCGDPSMKAAVAAVLSEMGSGGPVRVRPSQWPASRGVTPLPVRPRAVPRPVVPAPARP